MSVTLRPVQELFGCCCRVLVRLAKDSRLHQAVIAVRDLTFWANGFPQGCLFLERRKSLVILEVIACVYSFHLNLFGCALDDVIALWLLAEVLLRWTLKCPPFDAPHTWTCLHEESLFALTHTILVTLLLA